MVAHDKMLTLPALLSVRHTGYALRSARFIKAYPIQYTGAVVAGASTASNRLDGRWKKASRPFLAGSLAVAQQRMCLLEPLRYRYLLRASFHALSALNALVGTLFLGESSNSPVA